MKVILRDDIKSLGKAGDIKEVKTGYANNYLIPKHLAYPASDQYLRIFENDKKALIKKLDKEKKEAEKLKEQLENLSLNINVKVGEDEKLFGSVTAQDIADKLNEQGINLSKKQIVLEENIKKLGIYTIPVKILTDVEAKLKVWIIKE